MWDLWSNGKHSSIFLFFCLLLAHISWLNESFKTDLRIGASSEKRRLQCPLFERVGHILHYIWMFALSTTEFGRLSIGYSITYFMIATCSCGLSCSSVWSRMQWYDPLQCWYTIWFSEATGDNNKKHHRMTWTATIFR